MSGFPSRFLRKELGPRLVDTRQVADPQHEVSAARLNLLEHQAVGAALVVPRLTLVASWQSSAWQVSHQEEAWNADHQQGRPALTRLGAGFYTYTCSSTYLDEAGATVQLALSAARVSAQSLPIFGNPGSVYLGGAIVDPTNRAQIIIRILDMETSMGVDVPFWLEAL